MRIGHQVGAAVCLVALTLITACGGSDKTTNGPACDDGAMNGTETSVDCGGTQCGGCGIGQGCLVAADCDSRLCSDGFCACPTGYAPDAAGVCADVDECANGATCGEHATCYNNVGGYLCSCDIGYGGDGQTCTACEAGTWGQGCAKDCALEHCASGILCDVADGTVTSCAACEPGSWGSLCQSSCDLGDCSDAVVCDHDTGAVLGCT
ncbi:MAG: calcium-binding EGF-like domain-containing protein, partial [Propionibacteriaceae bacterium]|nr:calcium-binding EGF-like domain-containing protein [Propionibacteriaceae bacterium]